MHREADTIFKMMTDKQKDKLKLKDRQITTVKLFSREDV